VTRDHILFAIDQNRNIEAESPDAVGDLSDLLLVMPARRLIPLSQVGQYVV
jgi:hypothetical protein